MEKIIKDIKSGELTRDIDEKGAEGFWDYAGDIANGREDLQEVIYNALWGVVETYQKPSEETIFKCGECDWGCDWDMEQVASQGTPVCPECDCDMTLIINN